MASKINTLTYLSKYLDSNSQLQIYKTTILPIVEYANCFYSLIPKSITNKFQRLQNHAVRVIYYRSEVERKEDMLIMAKLPSVKQRAEKQLLCLMYRMSRLPNIYPQTVQDV